MPPPFLVFAALMPYPVANPQPLSMPASCYYFKPCFKPCFKLLLPSLISGLLLLVGCGQKHETPSVTAPGITKDNFVQWRDVTASAGIRFKHHNGAFGERWMPETVGSGAVFLDFDNDGDQDIFLVNGRNWQAPEVAQYLKGNGKKRARFIKYQPSNVKHIAALYRNDGTGRFEDVTGPSGLSYEMYGMGAAAGDYDNDGWIDLYVTGLNRNFLFHNQKGRFREVAAAAGVHDGAWSTSAAWLDYDRDGKLDLFVGHYIQWTPARDVYASIDGKTKSYVGPLSYQGQPNHLYRNLGKGRFADVSQKAGISGGPQHRLEGKALGVAICDYDNDSWPDIVVANDLTPNFLFHNKKNGTFDEVGVPMGIAYNEAGASRAGMGIDAGDIDASGQESIIIGNFADEMLGLYQQRNGLFTDTAPRSAIGLNSRKFLTFGVLFFDSDNDGRLDIFVANGHVDSDVGRVRQDVTYRQKPLLFHNEGKGAFREIGALSGAPLNRGYVGRGLAYADIDLDGDSDIVFTTNGEAAHLLRNEAGDKNNSVRLVLEGTQSNRSAIGAVVIARVGNNRVHRRVRSGSSYLSQSELPITIGLGSEKQVIVEILWPSGRKTTLPNVAAHSILTINETKGVVARATLRDRATTPQSTVPH